MARIVIFSPNYGFKFRLVCESWLIGNAQNGVFNCTRRGAALSYLREPMGESGFVRIALIVVGLLVFAGLGFWLFTSLQDAPQTTSPEMAASDAPTVSQEMSDQPTAPLVPPRFDIVRVDASGEAVVAGSSAPNAEVVLFANGAELATGTATSQGDWVIMVTTPLDAGDQEFSLEMRLPDGRTLKSEQVVVIAVPERPGLLPLVVLGQEGMASRVLQSPGPGISSGALSLDIVDYDESGAVILQGRSAPDTRVRAYVNNERIGDAVSDSQGRWSLTPDQSIRPGVYTLRIDQLSEDGSVTSRVEAPFERVARDVVQMASNQQVIVQPGNSLWRIARNLYGRGLQYTVIYQANADQIRDPDLIYPGQIFEVPTANE